MLKIWAFTFICIALYANVAVCDDIEFFENASVDLIKNLPNHFKDAIVELEKEDSANASMNITERIKFPRLPRLSQCFKDYLHMYTALLRKQSRSWALQVFDSWGKFPSGLARGNTYELGDFDECLKISVPNEFEPRYCILRIGQYELVLPPKSDPAIELARSMQNAMASVSPAESNGLQPRMVPTVSNMVALNLGICLPKSCTQKGIDGVLQKIQNTTRKLNKNLKTFSLRTIPYTCQTAEDLGWNLTAWDHTTLALIIFLVLAAAISTIYDVAQTKRDKEKHQIFIAFSLYTNGQKLFSCKKSRAFGMLECLNGMRVLSAFWVIYAHSNIVSLGGPVFNIKYLLEWFTEFSSIPMLMAWFSVDTFLFISGFLAVGSVLRTLQKTGSINIIKIYIHRYIRLTAILAFVILMSVTLYRRLAVGPLWWLFIEHGINCENYWWSSLLYIQNYYNPEAICLAHTWYLSVDMQLYLIAPILAYLLYRLGNPFMLVIVVLMGASIGWTYYLYYHYNLMFQMTNMKNDVQDVFIKTYYPTHIRLVPWLFGGAYAYYMNKSQGRKPKWSIVRVGIHWLVSGLLVVGLIWYTYNMQQPEHVASAMESGLYTGFSRLVWSILIMMVIHACITGHGGPVNSFLSLPMWRPLSRLTYAIYLIHMPVMMLTTGSLKRPIYFAFRANLFKYFGDLLVAVLLSILLTLGIESPVVNLENMLFSLCKRKPNNELPTNVTVRPLDESAQHSRQTAPVP